MDGPWREVRRAAGCKAVQFVVAHLHRRRHSTRRKHVTALWSDCLLTTEKLSTYLEGIECLTDSSRTYNIIFESAWCAATTSFSLGVKFNRAGELRLLC